MLPINNITLPSVDQNTNRFILGQGYGYDSNGNIIQDVDPTTGHSRQFAFNGDNKQTQATDATTKQLKGTYFYDGDGKRVKKVTADETTVFVYDGLGKLVAEYSTATLPAAPTINYTATDQLGSPRVVTNQSGAVVSRRDFMPYGEELTPTKHTARPVTNMAHPARTRSDNASPATRKTPKPASTSPRPGCTKTNTVDSPQVTRWFRRGNLPIRRRLIGMFTD